MPLPYTGPHGELNFEQDLVQLLTTAGWEPEIIQYKTVPDLINNWRQIINERNRALLNGVDLSDEEMDQVLNAVKQQANTPVKANLFIHNGDPIRGLGITRDKNSTDTVHAGKEVYLDLFNAREIAGGSSRYQIAEQVYFSTDPRFKDRRGDVTLLINGMPLIHIELKASGVALSEAYNQIIKYSKEGVFTGFMGLVQVFFAITPEDAVFFANAGRYNRFNSAFFFRWGDENNNIIKDWKQLIVGNNHILSIPEAHKLIGYYCVADKMMDVLKVCRSYQTAAIRAIVSRTAEQRWGDHEQKGGFVWCTTGGGKTMTSFKAGQLIIDLHLADKVVFVVDRKTLDTQSAEEYNSFSRDGEGVVQTKSSNDLFNKLRSSKADEHMILTSIQKMSRINEDAEKIDKDKLKQIQGKKLVFIVDEAHRSQFGEMHDRVKKTFYNALFFGFTGTPIFPQNMHEGEQTTETVFGRCLAIYSLATGIRDGNVLGFWPEAVKTYADDDLRRAVALGECHATDPNDIPKDSETWKLYKRIYNLPMASELDESGNIKKDKNGTLQKGIEDYLPGKQYDNPEHRRKVVDNILANVDTIAHGERGTLFHAILATTSIPEAYEYWKLFKEQSPELNVTSLFDPNTDADSKSVFQKETALTEIVDDYNKTFQTAFSRDTDPDYSHFKKDLTARLSHKKPYVYIGSDHRKCLDIVIVVDQLLTGFDSQYVNVLYLDKVMETDALIQAISRTNRIYDNNEKPWGMVKFYRKPYTMKRNLNEALKLYCQGDVSGVQVEDLEDNIRKMNDAYANISAVFSQEKIENFEHLPKSDERRNKFRKEYLTLKAALRASMLQGFKWSNEYGAMLSFDQKTYKILTMRYGDLPSGRTGGTPMPKTGYLIPTDLSTMEMDKIDAEYLEKQFRIVTLQDIARAEDYMSAQRKAIEEIRKNLGMLSEIQQKYARRVLRDIEDGSLTVKPGVTFMQYIEEYRNAAIIKEVKKEAAKFGIDPDMLFKVYMNGPTVDYVQLQAVEGTADLNKTKNYFNVNNIDGHANVSPFAARIKMHAELVGYISEQKAESTAES